MKSLKDFLPKPMDLTPENAQDVVIEQRSKNQGRGFGLGGIYLASRCSAGAFYETHRK